MPAITVIIPMYNAEKYIGECLDSILNQTFQDFEVIVIDDCSTDNSRAVVEDYAEKFGGRLKLERTLKNSGSGAFPRDKGVKLSRGEYLLIVDNDDAITPTALEELYSVAKKFSADVVACEKYYGIPNEFWHDAEFRRQLKPFSYCRGELVNKPTFLTNDLLERLNLCNRRYFLWNVWSKFIRRDLIFEREFLFPDSMFEDVAFTICLLCTAEKFLLVPNVVNYYRLREGSVSNDNKVRDEKFFRKYVKAFAAAFRYMNKFLSDRDAFRDNSYLKYLIFEICWSELLIGYILPMYNQNAAHLFDKILMEELSRDDNLALSAFTFNMSAFYRLQMIKAQQRIAELEETAREDKAYIAKLENFTAKLLNKE